MSDDRRNEFTQVRYPIGAPLEALVNLIVDGRQTELEELDPANKLLQYKLQHIEKGFEYPEKFARDFGTVLQKSLWGYRDQLDKEIRRLKISRA